MPTADQVRHSAIPRSSTQNMTARQFLGNLNSRGASGQANAANTWRNGQSSHPPIQAMHKQMEHHQSWRQNEPLLSGRGTEHAELPPSNLTRSGSGQGLPLHRHPDQRFEKGPQHFRGGLSHVIPKADKVPADSNATAPAIVPSAINNQSSGLMQRTLGTRDSEKVLNGAPSALAAVGGQPENECQQAEKQSAEITPPKEVIEEDSIPDTDEGRSAAGGR